MPWHNHGHSLNLHPMGCKLMCWVDRPRCRLRERRVTDRCQRAPSPSEARSRCRRGRDCAACSPHPRWTRGQAIPNREGGFPFGAQLCAAPVVRTLWRATPSLLGRADGTRTLPGRASWLGRAAARLRLDASPTSWESLAPTGLRRSGLCPHQSPGVGALKNVGVFLTGGSPSPRLDRLGPVRPRVLRPERTCIAPVPLRVCCGLDQRWR